MPVVPKPGVGDATKALEGVVVVRDDRLAGEVAARHDQYLRTGRISGQAEQQMMHRRVGDHHADVGMGRGDRVRQSQQWSGALAKQHDRSPIVLQESAFGVVGVGEQVHSREVGHHHRERFVAPILAFAQGGDRDIIGRVAGQVVAAETLHGDDRACPEQAPGFGHRGIAGELGLGRPMHGQDRSAVRAGHGLRVEPSVGRIGVLDGAGRAKRQIRHGRHRAVVGQIHDDGEARSAVGAADERVPVPPVGRIGQFGSAGRAGRHVRRDESASRPALRRLDDELGATPTGHWLGRDRLDPGESRSLRPEPTPELGHR